jgi:uncharacterized protein YukE
MDRLISVDPVEMFTAAVRVGFHADEVAAAHSSALGQVESSCGGGVGRSAAALDGVCDRWRSATQRHIERLDVLGSHVRAAGAGFDRTD